MIQLTEALIVPQHSLCKKETAPAVSACQKTMQTPLFLL